jgi:hypothetical protein
VICWPVPAFRCGFLVRACNGGRGTGAERGWGPDTGPPILVGTQPGSTALLYTPGQIRATATARVVTNSLLSEYEPVRRCPLQSQVCTSVNAGVGPWTFSKLLQSLLQAAIERRQRRDQIDPNVSRTPGVAPPDGPGIHDQEHGKHRDPHNEDAAAT